MNKTKLAKQKIGINIQPIIGIINSMMLQAIATIRSNKAWLARNLAYLEEGQATNGKKKMI